MRAVLYVTSSALLLGAAGGMAFLTRFAPQPLLFVLAGAALSLLLGAAWVALSATAGNRPRPHLGPVLALAGGVALALAWWEGRLLDAAWAALVALAGTVAAIALLRRSGRGGRREPGPVRAPLGHRERL